MASHWHLVGGDPQAPKEGGESHLKRIRSHQVSFRLNDKEYALLQRKLAASGLSLTEFFIETISKGKVIVINDFIPLLSELKRQGVNLNQLTRRINQFSPMTEQEIITTLQQCQNTYLYSNEIHSKVLQNAAGTIFRLIHSTFQWRQDFIYAVIRQEIVIWKESL